MAKNKTENNVVVLAEKTDEGLRYNGFILEPVVEKCNGCERIVARDGSEYCTTYPSPAAKWSGGVCNFATHVRASMDKQGNVKVNPLKASKRASRGR